MTSPNPIDEIAFKLQTRMQQKRPWSETEDELLSTLVTKFGPENWDTLAEAIKGRNGKQCRERYRTTLDPNIRKGNWTPEEDCQIIELQQKMGNQWAKIARTLSNRTDNAVKNRFYALSKAESCSGSLPEELAFINNTEAVVPVTKKPKSETVYSFDSSCAPL
jgi:hypothetical protein